MASIRERDVPQDSATLRAAQIGSGSVLAPLMTTLTFALLLAMLIGPLASGTSIELSPYHSHVFLLSNGSAQQLLGDDLSHAHGENSQDVVSVFDHSGGTNSIPFHMAASYETVGLVRLTNSVQLQQPDLIYADALSQPPEQPPRAA